jgi:type II secretory ATPase GspE/PulE/Tfp pilus assembly ATPase PilB-like protein
MYSQLNDCQKKIFERIINYEKKIFFIDGPGGSGKTFSYKTLIYYFVSEKKSIVNGLDGNSLNIIT